MRIAETAETIFAGGALPKEFENIVARFEAELAQLEPTQLGKRFELVDRLDALFEDEGPQADVSSTVDAAVWHRLKSQRTHLEAMNDAFCRSIRAEIQRGLRPTLFSRWLQLEENAASGLSFDSLDDLVSGVLKFDEFVAPARHPAPEMVFYQPTPARHIFRLLRLAALLEADTLVDLGSGLGHVPLLASICTGARAIGIEMEEAYVTCARRCAQRLNIGRVSFLHKDARDADLGSGTVYYLYTPFAGSILDSVLKRLRQEATVRAIRICTFGPCTDAIAREPWLEAARKPEPGQINIFRSRG